MERREYDVVPCRSKKGGTVADVQTKIQHILGAYWQAGATRYRQVNVLEHSNKICTVANLAWC